jgi:signal transduction histidine kinase
MADATRAHHWASTPLGPIETWSETLLGTVNMLLCSPLPTILFWGEAMTQLYNDAVLPLLTEDRSRDALGQSGRTFWHDSWPAVGHQLEGALYRGESTNTNKVLIPIYRHGVLEDVWWNYTYVPVYLPDGSIGGLLDFCQDVTAIVIADRERDQALAALRAERARLLDIFQQAPMFFALLEGPTHIYTLTNSLYNSVTGNRDILGKPVAEAIPEVTSQGYIEVLDKVFHTGEPYVASGATIELVQVAGQPPVPRVLDFVYQPLREADGSISGIIVIGVDVTERKQTEQALIQNEKLAAVGRLAASIAHEINNPLESVTNLLYLAHTSDMLEDIQRYLTLADSELRRAAAITSQTLRFHRQATDPVPASGEEMLRSTLRLFQGRINNAQVEVETRIDPAPPILCYDGEVRQVLGNLVGNAIDAMRPQDILSVRSHTGTDWVTGRRGLVLTIADSGTGMPAEVAARAFEAFFTTKGLSGTGLGLWISANIVARHHGRLRVRSSQRPGASGTAFRLFLPFETTPERSEFPA